MCVWFPGYPDRAVMKLLNQLYARHRNLLLYCIIGCVGATLDFVIFSALTTLANIYHQTANFISVSAGIIVNFFLNYHFNFKSSGKLLSRLFSFYLIGLLGLGFSAALLWIFIDRLAIPVAPAKIVTIFFVTMLQYTLNKYISFKKRNK